MNILKLVGIVLILLVLQYILGMFVAMFGVPPDDPNYATETVWPKMAFFIHAANGLALLAGAIWIFILGRKSKDEQLRGDSFVALGSVLLAFAAGIATVALKETPAEIASFIMALGFLLSFIFFGKIYLSFKKN